MYTREVCHLFCFRGKNYVLEVKTDLSRVAYISGFIRQACLAVSCHCVCPLMTFKLISFVHKLYLVHKERVVFTGHYAVIPCSLLVLLSTVPIIWTYGIVS